MDSYDVAIVGAGPYGLSVAAHLRSLRPRRRLRAFGEPMSFWATHMPEGMLLRSPWVASNLSDPRAALTLDAFCAEKGLDFHEPIPLSCFIEYGHWFQQQGVPEVDGRSVTRIESRSGGYLLLLDTGDRVAARRVVVAAGIGYFPFVPQPFRNMPAELVSHSSQHRDLHRFAGREVVVVGAGQSALESAALLHEAGATVEVLARGDAVRWLHQRPLLHRWPLRPLLYAPPDVGPALLSHLISHPNLYRRLSRRRQDRWGPRAIRAAGAAWLVPRLESVPIHASRRVARSVPTGDRLRLIMDDASEKVVDHVVLGTGYRIDLGRYPFIDRPLLSTIRAVDGYPVLDAGFESTAAGLHFVGAPAAWSFGPLMRFVAGAQFTCRAVARRVARD